ncbi:MAG TPA: ECF-type sigma factor [Bryobacteraceae bacterium]|jgi:RNA polymerase sigma factor (TIGR02999 family)
MEPKQESITRLLHELSAGHRQAFDALMPLVYDQLRKLAANCLKAEKPGHTLAATALVHEAYLRLVDSDIAWEDRVHFYAVAARVIRRILVDHARASGRQKRGGASEKIQLDEALIAGRDAPEAVMELDDTLRRLESQDARKGRIVEMIFFGGMTYEETATALRLSPATVHRELRMAKAWLHRELTQSASSSS